jgi:hypothetical protein
MAEKTSRLPPNGIACKRLVYRSSRRDNRTSRSPPAAYSVAARGGCMPVCRKASTVPFCFRPTSHLALALLVNRNSNRADDPTVSSAVVQTIFIISAKQDLRRQTHSTACLLP